MSKKHSQAVQPETQDPPVEVQELPVLQTRPGEFWPEGKNMPEYVVKARDRQQPCPKCRRVFQPDGRQAVACLSSGAESAYYRCQSCGHRWKMPVKAV